MKKLLLLAAFAGMLTSSAIANTYGDDKDKNKKECKKSKACAGEKKEGCTKGEKSCCKKKNASAASAADGEKSNTEKK